LRGDLKSYVDGELAGLRATFVRGHLARCATCRQEADWLRHVGQEMRELENAVPRPELRSRIMASLPVAPPASQPSSDRTQDSFRRSSAPRFALAGGTLCLLLGGAFAMRGAFAPNPTLPENPAPTVATAPAPKEKPSAAPSIASTQVAPIAKDPVTAWADAESEKKERERLQRQNEAQRQIVRAVPKSVQAQQPLPTENAIPMLRLTAGATEMMQVKLRLQSLAPQMGAELATHALDERGQAELAGRKRNDVAMPPIPKQGAERSAEPGEWITLRLPAPRVAALLKELGHYGKMERVVPKPRSTNPAAQVGTKPNASTGYAGLRLPEFAPEETAANLVTLRLHLKPLTLEKE
jgi:hypothetical protein